jgi:hypothetical protein
MSTNEMGVCPLCEHVLLVPLINGYCQLHHAAPFIGKYRGKQQGVIEPVQDPELDAWYADRVKTMSDHCMECRERIATWNAWYAKAAIAHILPKKLFRSVRTHPLNYLILGGGCGHHYQYDRSWESAATMKVFPLAIERLMQFYHEIDLRERRLLPDILRAYV